MTVSNNLTEDYEEYTKQETNRSSMPSSRMITIARYSFYRRSTKEPKKKAHHTEEASAAHYHRLHPKRPLPASLRSHRQSTKIGPSKRKSQESKRGKVKKYERWPVIGAPRTVTRSRTLQLSPGNYRQLMEEK